MKKFYFETCCILCVHLRVHSCTCIMHVHSARAFCACIWVCIRVHAFYPCIRVRVFCMRICVYILRVHSARALVCVHSLRAFWETHLPKRMHAGTHAFIYPTCTRDMCACNLIKSTRQSMCALPQKHKGVYTCICPKTHARTHAYIPCKMSARNHVCTPHTAAHIVACV